MSPEAQALGDQPAYPVANTDRVGRDGMTIHQSFAKAAMQSLLPTCIVKSHEDLEHVMVCSLESADALCEALAKEGK